MKYLPQTLALLVLSVFLRADSWNTGGLQPAPGSAAGTWEQTPAGGDDPGLLDSYIQDLKWEVRRRLEVEVDFGPVSADSGLMREGSARGFVTATDCVANVTSFAAEDDHASDSPGPYVPASELNSSSLLTGTPAGWGQALGVGRFCVSASGPPSLPADPTQTTDDDGKLYYHSGAGGWLEVKAQHDDIAEISRQKSGAANQVPCGGFECMSTLLTTAPTDYGWADVGTPTSINYVASHSSNGDGLMVRIVGNAAFPTGEGISYTFNGLRPAKTYWFYARAFANGAGDECRMRINDGTTDTNQTTSPTVGSFVTLRTQFTTTGAPAPVVLSLIAGNAGGSDQCDFDLLAVYEEDVFNQPSAPSFIRYDESTAVTGLGPLPPAATDLSLIVVAPGDNYVNHVTAVVCAGADLGALIQAGIVTTITRDGSIVRTNSSMTPTNGSPSSYFWTTTLDYVDRNPGAGTSHTYVVQAAEVGANLDMNFNSGLDAIQECTSSLTVHSIRTD